MKTAKENFANLPNLAEGSGCSLVLDLHEFLRRGFGLRPEEWGWDSFCWIRQKKHAGF